MYLKNIVLWNDYLISNKSVRNARGGNVIVLPNLLKTWLPSVKSSKKLT